jgi:hypothetical protein
MFVLSTTPHSCNRKKRKKMFSFQATCSSYSPASLAELTISKSHEKLQTTFINSTVLAFYKASTHHTAPGSSWPN